MGMPCCRWVAVRASTVASSIVTRVLRAFSQAAMRSSISRRMAACAGSAPRSLSSRGSFARSNSMGRKSCHHTYFQHSVRTMMARQSRGPRFKVKRAARKE
jgi:hypothetical protein